VLSQHQEISSDLGLKARASIVMEILFTYNLLAAAIPSALEKKEISLDFGSTSKSIVMEIIFTYHLCAAIPSIPAKNIHQGPEKNAAHRGTPEVGLHKIDILFLNIIRLRTAKHLK
jgi:hypothetical protein